MRISPAKLGGSLAAFGSAMMASGILPNKTSDNIDILWWVAFTGFLFNCVGVLIAHLFAPDAKDVRENSDNIEGLKTQMHLVSPALESGKTEFLRAEINKSDAEDKARA